MSGFKHFTDYRCFHFARRDFTERGVTKTVGICECKQMLVRQCLVTPSYVQVRWP